MKKSTVTLKPLSKSLIEELVTLHGEAENLNAIVQETRKIQYIAERISDCGDDAETVAQLSSLHQKSLEVASDLVRRRLEQLAGMLREYLAEGGISLGDTLMDEFGKPFDLKHVGVWVSGRPGEVYFQLRSDEPVPRLSINAEQGRTVTVLK